MEKQLIFSTNSNINFDEIVRKGVVRKQQQTKTITKTQSKPNVTKILKELKGKKKEVKPKKEIKPKESKKKELKPKEESTKKQKIILKILNYQTSRIFGEYITKEMKINYGESQLEKYKLNKLEQIINKIKLGLNKRSTDKFYENLVKNGTYMLENCINPFYNIDGFSEEIENNLDFWQAYEEFRIEQGVQTQLPCKVRLLYIIGYTMYMRNLANKYKVKMNKKNELSTKESLRFDASRLTSSHPTNAKNDNIEIINNKKKKKEKSFLENYNFN